MSNRTIDYVPLLTEDASFQLVRTNPKLTGNVKVTVNELGEMWLESIKANPELSKDIYSKISIDVKQSHPANIFRFFNNGTTPNEVIFDLIERVDSTKTSNDYKDQYDFSHYFSGVKYLASNKYSERMSYFAPLYLKKDIPNYFIIFKIDDPVNFPLDVVKELYEAGQTTTDQLRDIFSRASIIKTFDLSPESNPGKYLRDYVNSSNFPTSPLTVGFEENDFTTWNGIMINEGKFGSKGELLHSLYTSSQPLKFFEENITNGFSRNGILFPNIINLEFVFNDDSSEKYDFNRYIGLYVNTIELSKLDIDLDRAYLTRSTWENIPHFRKKFLDTDDVIVTQTNSDGVIVPYKNASINISEFKDSFLDSSNMFINYISDKDGRLYMPKLARTNAAILSSVDTKVTVSLLNHGYSIGDVVSVDSSDSQYSGNFTITAALTDSFEYDVLTSPTNTNSFGRITLVSGKKLISPFEIDYSSQITVNINSSGLVATASSLDPHGYQTDDLIVIASSDQQYAGEFQITVTGPSTFTYSLPEAPSSLSASGTAKKELQTGQIRFANRKIDLGLFFGQSRNLFLQDTGFGTSTQGHSHSVIKINANLNNYDEIRIYHPHGTRVDTNGKHDLITSTQLYPLIPNAGEYYIYNDYDNVLGFDEFYMNGGGYLTQVASALANCINGIRNRAFTAYVYDDRVFIKLNPGGDFDSDYRVSFTSPSSNYSVVTIYDKTGSNLIGSQISFRGGSKEKGNRLIIEADHLDKINRNLDSILIKSSDSWSKIRKVSQYIDEVTESNSATESLRKKTISNYENKIALVLDEDETPTISHNEFLMRPKFRPSLGLLSFLSIKDLDLDFYASTYTNFPEIDLYQHYFIPPNTNLLEPGIKYGVYNGSIQIPGVVDINGYPEPYTGTSTEFPFTVASQTSYSIVSGSPLVTTYIEDWSNSFNPIKDQNQELIDFAGFSILKDPAKVVSQNSSTEYTLKTKYLNGLTNTEYDFYKENESLDFALRSKIIPYITKWGIKNGRDTRDNPYRLNTELVFGRNNFSPDHEDRTQNPLNFTHEWFYIESKFNYVNDDFTVARNTNYFEESLDLDALATDENYFINYFTYTPTNLSGKEIADTQFRYSSLYKNSANQYEAFFRGFKLTFKDVTDPTVTDVDGKPIANPNSTRFDGYKFSCILKPVRENINDSTQPPIKYKVIEHKDYKFILLVIELSIGYLGKSLSGPISSYSINSPGTGYTTTFLSNVTTTAITGSGRGLVLTIIGDGLGGISSVIIKNDGLGYQPGDLIKINSGNSDAILQIDDVLDTIDPSWGQIFSLTPPHSPIAYVDNTNFIDNLSFPFSPILPFETINGDYRIEFDANEVSNLTQTYLYSLKNKKYNSAVNAFSNIKMASKLNIATGVSIFDATVSKLNLSTISNYPSILTDDIIKPTDSTLILIRDINANLDLALDEFSSFAPQSRNIIDYSIENFIHYDSNQGASELCLVNITDNPPALYGVLPLSSTSAIIANYAFKVLTGGEKYFEKIFEKISFAKFKKYVNSLDPIIEYYSYSDGSGTPVENPNFYLEILDHSYIEKSSQLITNYTTSIPVQFSGQDNIGVDYEVAQLPVPYELNRYKGEYEPVVQNYSIYQSNFKFNNNRIADLSLSNVRLNTEVSDLLTIKNFNHIKVARRQILELESDESYLPIYPKIGEIAIGQAEYFLLQGNWDWGFHHKYLDKTTFDQVSGALRVEEDDSFLSKLITLPESIELENIQVGQPLLDTQDFNTVDLSSIELVYKETPSTIEGIINVNNILTRFLMEDGIINKFNEYLVNSNQFIGNFNSIENYVREYIRLNILKLYDIDSNEFYSKKDNTLVSTTQKSGSNPNTIDFVSLTDKQRFAQGFELIKAVQINKKDRMLLKFSFTKKQGSGLQISPKIKIKFI